MLIVLLTTCHALKSAQWTPSRPPWASTPAAYPQLGELFSCPVRTGSPQRSAAVVARRDEPVAELQTSAAIVHRSVDELRLRLHCCCYSADACDSCVCTAGLKARTGKATRNCAAQLRCKGRLVCEIDNLRSTCGDGRLCNHS